MKKILIISDTHSHIDNTILKYVKETDEVWHAGDIGNIKILTEIEKHYEPGRVCDGRIPGKIESFWGNVYRKGDYAQSHCHKPSNFSFAYFVKSKWYDSPLIFNDSGKRIRPKEGRYVIFPSYLLHSVPKHRYNHERITLSGNYNIRR